MLQLYINIAFKLSLNPITKQKVLEYHLSETSRWEEVVFVRYFWFYAAAM